MRCFRSHSITPSGVRSDVHAQLLRGVELRLLRLHATGHLRGERVVGLLQAVALLGELRLQLLARAPRGERLDQRAVHQAVDVGQHRREDQDHAGEELLRPVARGAERDRERHEPEEAVIL
jgi:hypothetical protein